MTLYKTESRGQKIKDLISSLPYESNKTKTKQLLIDHSFKHAQLLGSGKAERSIFNKTIHQLIQKQKLCIIQERQSQEIKQHLQTSRQLNNYVRKNENNKTLNLEAPTGLRTPILNNETHLQKVYLERKYNSQLVYQVQNILQAKQIEESKQKIKLSITKGQQSPLIRNVMKITRTERKTAENCPKRTFGHSRYQTSKENSFVDELEYCPFANNQKNRSSFNTITKKIGLLSAKSSYKGLKKYSSTVHFSTPKTSSHIIPSKQS